MPVIIIIVIAILREPERVHHRPLRMIGIEPLNVMLMPPAGAVPDVIVIVSPIRILPVLRNSLGPYSLARTPALRSLAPTPCRTP